VAWLALAAWARITAHGGSISVSGRIWHGTARKSELEQHRSPSAPDAELPPQAQVKRHDTGCALSQGQGRLHIRRGLPMRIEDYALIGDLQTSALVGRNGSVDWLCLPHFDSASCFTALLGEEKHGRWLIAPAGEVRVVSRRYREGTLVLETDFETADGTARVIDFMPPRDGGAPQLMRIVQAARSRPDAHAADHPLRVWPDRALGTARARRHRRPGGGRRGAPEHTGGAARGESHHGGGVHRPRRHQRAVRPQLVPLLRAPRPCRGRSRGSRPHPGVVAGVVGAVHLPR
jgi:hypothetical protein